MASGRRAWHYDRTNDRLDIYYNGARLGHVDSTGLTILGTVTAGANVSNGVIDDTIEITGGLTVDTSLTLSDGGTVTQITTAATGVTLDTNVGQITTVTQNIAAAGEVQFTVTCAAVAAVDVVVANIASGHVGGTPIVSVTVVAAGSFQLTITNLHASVAETGTLVINYAVIKGSAT